MNSKFYYSLPTEIYFGEGQIYKLNEIVGKGNRILLVCGRRFLKESGWLKRIRKLLKGNKIFLFEGVYENPDIALIEEGVSFAKKSKINLVIGIGGGSVLDCAKAISVLCNNKGFILSYLDKKETLINPGKKYIAVPTTAGSASEVTPYSVISVPERGIKITLTHKYLCPDVAIVDPVFLKSLSKSQIANPGIDVLCHAIEAYWNVNNNPVSDVFALEAIGLVFKNIYGLYKNRLSKRARMNMARASLFAGLAFSNTRTTACHSISYPLTTTFGVAHGQACAITLPKMFLFNAKTQRKRLLKVAAIIGVKTVEEAVRKIRSLMLEVGLEVKLSRLGIAEKDLVVILAKGFTPERMINNPRKVTRAAIHKILKEIF